MKNVLSTHNKYHKCSKSIKVDNFNEFFDRVIAETSTGCLLAGSALGKKGTLEKYNQNIILTPPSLKMSNCWSVGHMLAICFTVTKLHMYVGLDMIWFAMTFG